MVACVGHSMAENQPVYAKEEETLQGPIKKEKEKTCMALTPSATLRVGGNNSTVALS